MSIYILHGDWSSIRHMTLANVLVPLKDVKYEGDYEMVACRPHCEHERWRMGFGTR